MDEQSIRDAQEKIEAIEQFSLVEIRLLRGISTCAVHTMNARLARQFKLYSPYYIQNVNCLIELIYFFIKYMYIYFI